ncbi:MAG: 50S ribosomal protein L10 [Microscillaceae bacterium]
MTKEEKGVLLEELSQKFAQYTNYYFLDAAGMTVAQTNKFRRFCFEKGIEYKVVKNSLIKKVLESMTGDYTPLNKQVLKGFSGVLFSDNGSAPAKFLKEFRKTGADKPLFKGASIDASIYVGEESLDALTKVRSKQDVLAELMGMLQSPGAKLVGALKSPPQKLVSALQSGQNNLTGLLKALEAKKEAA